MFTVQYMWTDAQQSNYIFFKFLEDCLNNTLQYTGYPVCHDLRHRIVHYMQ